MNRKQFNVSAKAGKRHSVALVIMVAVLASLFVVGQCPLTVRAATETDTPNGCVFSQGSTYSGSSTTDTATDNGVYHVVQDSATYDFNYYYTFDGFSGTPDDVVKIEIHVNAKRTGSGVMNSPQMYVYGSGGWIDMGAFAIGTTDTNFDKSYTDQATIDLILGASQQRVQFYRYEASNQYHIATDHIYIKYTTNTAPTVDAVSHEEDPYGMLVYVNYANYRDYTYWVNVTDAEGYADIDCVELWSVGGSPQWVVQYHEDTNTFAEKTGTSYVALNVSACSATRSGTTIKTRFEIKIGWDATPSGALYGWVNDTAGASDSAADGDAYSIVQTVNVGDLYPNGARTGFLSDTRHNVGGALTASDQIIYAGMYLEVYVPYTEVTSVTIRNVNTTTDYTDTTYDASGFSMTVYLSPTVSNDMFNCSSVLIGGANRISTWSGAYVQADWCIADRVVVTVSAVSYVGIGQTVTVTKTGIFDYDDTAFDGTITLNSSTFSYSTTGSHGYTAQSVSGGLYGITAFTSNAVTVTWVNVTCTVVIFWTKDIDADNWYANIHITNLQWTNGVAVPNGAIVYFYENTSLFATVSVYGQSALTARYYGTNWTDCYVVWTMKIVCTETGYDVSIMQFYEVGDDVPIVHTLYVDVFSLTFTSTHAIVAFETNWHNATLTVWRNGTYVAYYSSEGIKVFVLPTAVGYWNFTLLINGSAPKTQGTFNAAYPDSDFWEWREFGYEVPEYVLNEHVTFIPYDAPDSMWFVVTSDLSPIYLKAYDNGSLVIVQTVITNILRFTKSADYGWHNVTVLVGSTGYGWLTFYCGYDVVERIVYVAYYDVTTGMASGIAYGDVITLVNGTTQVHPVFWVTGNTLNITITDYYGNVIAQNTSYPYSETVYIGLTWYEVTFVNLGIDNIRFMVFQNGRNTTIEVQPLSFSTRRFVYGNYTVWVQYAVYDVNFEVESWMTFKTVTYELGEYRQVIKQVHTEMPDAFQRIAGAIGQILDIVAVASLLFAVIGFGMSQFQLHQIKKTQKKQTQVLIRSNTKKPHKQYRDGSDDDWNSSSP